MGPDCKTGNYFNLLYSIPCLWGCSSGERDGCDVLYALEKSYNCKLHCWNRHQDRLEVLQMNDFGAHMYVVQF